MCHPVIIPTIKDKKIVMPEKKRMTDVCIALLLEYLPSEFQIKIENSFKES